MTPFYLSEFSIEGEHDQTQLSPFPTTDHASSFPFPVLFNNPQEHQSQQLQAKPIDFMLIGSTEEEDSQVSGKWMSSKMRIMRKMMINSNHSVAAATSKNLDQGGKLNQDISSRSSSNTTTTAGGIIRVCSDCNTTKTPLWRSGPRGPKSLCNACGIRQRKARRAIATAAGGSVATQKPTKKRSKEKGADVDRTVPFKKRCRMINTATSGAAKKKLRFDDFKVRLSKNSALHPMFPEDERDAAILLMALSCGLIRS